MKRYLFCGILIFLLSIIIGYSYSRIWDATTLKQNEKIVYESRVIENKVLQNTNESIVETISDEEKILPTTSFAIKKIFGKCGHFKFSYTELPIELVNLKKEEVENMYSDWKIDDFSEKEVVLAKEFDEMCDEHFIIKLSDGFIKIYNKINETDLKLYKETEIAKEYLTEDDIQKLEIGILVYGKGQLNSIIEDFE